MKVTFTARQEYDLCGDEFLNEREVEVVIHLDRSNHDHLWCDIGEIDNLCISTRILQAALDFLYKT